MPVGREFSHTTYFKPVKGSVRFQNEDWIKADSWRMLSPNSKESLTDERSSLSITKHPL
jgi:hypothetical protein